MVQKILYRRLDLQQMNLELWAGNYVVQLNELYYAKQIDIFNLEKKLWKLYYELGMPSWLTMLARNCEYSTDISAYEEPFAKEFEYIVSLWRKAASLEEFNSNYSREISNSHDVKWLLTSRSSISRYAPWTVFKSRFCGSLRSLYRKITT